MDGVYEYQVIADPLRIRDMPYGLTLGYLLIDDRFMTDLAEQSEVSGYLWAHHARGWSALHTISCSEVYAVIVGSVAMAGDPNKCYDEWDCRPDDHSMWHLGWCVAAAERGEISGGDCPWPHVPASSSGEESERGGGDSKSSSSSSPSDEPVTEPVHYPGCTQNGVNEYTHTHDHSDHDHPYGPSNHTHTHHCSENSDRNHQDHGSSNNPQPE